MAVGAGGISHLSIDVAGSFAVSIDKQGTAFLQQIAPGNTDLPVPETPAAKATQALIADAPDRSDEPIQVCVTDCMWDEIPIQQVFLSTALSLSQTPCTISDP